MQVAHDKIQLRPIVNNNTLLRLLWRREFLICRGVSCWSNQC